MENNILKQQVSQTTTLFMAEKNKTVPSHSLSAQGISAAVLQQSSMREIVGIAGFYSGYICEETVNTDLAITT